MNRSATANDTPALIATLGLRPQVIPRALDLLLDERAEPGLGEVIVAHTAAFARNHPQWRSLADFRAYAETRYSRIRWRWAPILDAAGATLRDVESPEAAMLAFRHIYNEVKRVKQTGRRLHGLIAGGRKSMIVYMMVSAQLLFDVDDRLWHLFSADEEAGSQRATAEDSLSHLVEIPVLHLAGLMPVVRQLILTSDDPTAAIGLYREHESVEQTLRLQTFFDHHCDEVDRRLLLLFYHGADNRQAAVRVHLAESSVSRRMNEIARRFYHSGLGPPLPSGSGRLVQHLLKDMRPFLSRLRVDDF